MKEIFTLVLGIVVIALGIPIGNLLAKHTRDEQKIGQSWFKTLILLSFLGAVISLIYRKDTLLFTFLFIAIVTSRSLRKR